MEQHAVTAEPGHMAIDGFGADPQITRSLAMSHATDDFGDEVRIEVWELLPVGCRESLCAEASFACFACKPLDTEWILLSLEVTNFFILAGIGVFVVVNTVRVGAVGRNP